MIRKIIALTGFIYCLAISQAKNVNVKVTVEPIKQKSCYIVNFADNDKIREAVIPRMESVEVSLDGKLNEACWHNAAILDDFRLLEHKLKPGQSDIPSQKTVAKMFYTNKCLYIGVVCFEKNIDKVKSIWKNYGDPVWNEDSVEIFIDTNYDRKTYWHLACNSIGTRNSAYYGTMTGKTAVSQEGFLMSATGTAERKVLPNKPWPMSWKVATSKSQDLWTVEIAIPFAFLGLSSAPTDYTLWGFNIGRERYAGKQEFSNWQKLGYGFNEVQYYGRIFFNKAPNFRIKSFALPCPIIGKNALRVFLQPKSKHSKSQIKIKLQTIPTGITKLQSLKYNEENTAIFDVDTKTKLLKILFDEAGTTFTYHTYPITVDKILTANLSEDTIATDDDSLEVICNVKLGKNLLKKSTLKLEIDKADAGEKILTGQINHLNFSRFKLMIPISEELQEGDYKLKLKLMSDFPAELVLPFEVVEF